MNSFIRLIHRYKDMVVITLAALAIGIIVGGIAAVFGRVLIAITSFRATYALYLIPFLGIAGFCIIKAYERWGKNSIKGMSLIFEAGHRSEEKISARLIPLVMVATWLTHLFGGSAGREGVAVQIGATVGCRAGRLLKCNEASHILLIAGMAAGFSGLFRTPIAAVFFALEVLTAGKLLYGALLPALAASYAASVTSSLLGLEKFSVTINESVIFLPELAVKLILLGLTFGLVGRGFAFALHRLKSAFGKWMPNAAKRALIVGIIISMASLLCFMGRYSGLGTNLIFLSFSGEVYGFDWILKLMFTIVTLAAGYQGGEVTPLFAIGATLGAFLAAPLGLPVMLSAALGYSAVFGSASNTLLAPIFIGAEVFGFVNLPFFFPVCALAYVFNGNRTIYSKQKIAE